MKLTDHHNKCPHCGGTLQFELFTVDELDNGIRRPVETQYEYFCNHCQVKSDWRRTRAGAIESMAAKVAITRPSRKRASTTERIERARMRMTYRDISEIMEQILCK